MKKQAITSRTKSVKSVRRRKKKKKKKKIVIRGRIRGGKRRSTHDKERKGRLLKKQNKGE